MYARHEIKKQTPVQALLQSLTNMDVTSVNCFFAIFTSLMHTYIHIYMHFGNSTTSFHQPVMFKYIKHTYIYIYICVYIYLYVCLIVESTIHVGHLKGDQGFRRNQGLSKYLENG